MVYRRKGEIVTRSIAGETILVPIRAKLADMEQLVVLDGIGNILWDRIDGKTDFKTMLDSVLEEFDVDAEQAGKDIQEFLAALKSADLIEEAG